MASLPGEPHVLRADLVAQQPAALEPEGESILRLAQLTDLHVTDAQSPARFEFVNDEAGDPRYRELMPMFRPQEMLNTHAVAEMVGAINAMESIDLVVVTGDSIDNTQRNELDNVLALLNGGTVHPDSGSSGYDGVQRVEWPGQIFWKPDGSPDGDRYQREHGFPARPGLLEEAVRPFHSEGLRKPWLRCWGNHEQLCQGVGIATPPLIEAMRGSRKPVELPPGITSDRAVEIFREHPERFLVGASRAVAADPARRPIQRSDLAPATYYSHDAGEVRLITLDTVCDSGGADGTVDATQLQWLTQQLEESKDHYVVILSHHGSWTIANADELLAVIDSHSNVVLWLNGHIHASRIRPRGTFWEVTTASLVDWPCQARQVELLRLPEGLLAIRCTMIDHDGGGLAGLHRELAGNVPGAGFESGSPGSPSDRNAILLLPDPLHRVA